jgi:hypothetical protein
VHSNGTHSLPLSLLNTFRPLNYCGNNTSQTEAQTLRLPKIRTILVNMENTKNMEFHEILYLNKHQKRIIITKDFVTRYKNSLLGSYELKKTISRNP